jgi:hypothetical protein
MAFESGTKLLSGSRLVFGYLHFIADRMRDLRMQEPEQQKILGLGPDQFPLILVWVGLACEPWPRHDSCRSGLLEFDLTRDRVDHHEICCPIIAYPIYKSMTLLNSDSDDDWEILMVRQGEPPIGQTKEEITWAVEAEIAQAEKLVRNTNKVVAKKHVSPWDQCDGSKDLEKQAGDGATSGGTTLSSTDVALVIGRDYEHEAAHCRRNSVVSSGRVSKCTTCWPITLLPLVP